MRSIRLSTSNSAQGGGRAQPDACQRWLAAQIEPVKGERSEFILTLDGSGRIIPRCKQRQCLIVSYQPAGRRLSWLHVLPLLHVRHVLLLTIKRSVSILRVRPDGVQRLGARFVGGKANLWNLERKLSRNWVGHYLLNVPKAPINESLLLSELLCYQDMR